MRARAHLRPPRSLLSPLKKGERRPHQRAKKPALTKDAKTGSKADLPFDLPSGAYVVTKKGKKAHVTYHLKRRLVPHQGPLGEVPVENVRTVPGDHAFAAQDHLEGALDVANAVRDARQVRGQAIAMILGRSALSSYKHSK